MKITELYDAVMNALRREKFVGNFEVTIHRPSMQDVKITGYKRSSDEYPYDFSDKLKSEIDKICYLIVDVVIPNEGFTFDIKGRVEYEYTPEE